MRVLARSSGSPRQSQHRGPLHPPRAELAARPKRVTAGPPTPTTATARSLMVIEQGRAVRRAKQPSQYLESKFTHALVPVDLEPLYLLDNAIDPQRGRGAVQLAHKFSLDLAGVARTPGKSHGALSCRGCSASLETAHSVTDRGQIATGRSLFMGAEATSQLSWPGCLDGPA